jgi:hypothetical protein
VSPKKQAKPPTKQAPRVIERSFRIETVELTWLAYLQVTGGDRVPETSRVNSRSTRRDNCRREEITLVQIFNDTLEQLGRMTEDIRFQRALAVQLSKGYTEEEINLARAFAARGGAAPLDYPPLLALIDEIAKAVRPPASLRDAWQEKAQQYGAPWAYIEEQVRAKRAVLRKKVKAGSEKKS